MKYVRWTPPTAAREGWESWSQRFLARVLGLVLPRASPDLEQLYPRVAEWWLEVVDPDGAAEREIGFDREGNPIVLGPIGRNMGMVTDSPMRFTDCPADEEVRERFQAVWDRLLEEWRGVSGPG